MAKTRSKGSASPKTPTSAKSKKVGSIKKDVPEGSPSVKKTKNIKKKIVKKVEETPVETKEEPVKEAVKEVVSSVVPEKVSVKAISELAKFLKREETETTTEKTSLFDDEDDEQKTNLYLQINTKKFYSDRPQLKPKVIQLSNPIYNQENLKTCLIVRDQLVTTEEQLEALENEKLPTVSQILPLKTLKTEYKHFEKRRQLYNDYDLFIVDDAVFNLMPTLLGKVFYSNGAKKTPFPVRVTSTKNPKELSLVTLKNQLNKCLTSTSFLPPMGVTVVVKIGSINSNFTQAQLAQNLQDVLVAFDKESIKSVMLKTKLSPALPLYYTENLYEESDVLENIKPSEVTKDEVTPFEKGLLEFADAQEVAKILKKSSKSNNTKPSKVQKPQKA